MNLLFLDQFSEPGGAQLQLLDLLPAIRERAWNATVAMPGDGEMFRRVRALGFAAERIECGPYTSGRKSLPDAVRFVAETPAVARRIAKLAADADLVYINGPRLLPAAAWARLRVPILFHSHSFLFPGIVRSLAGMSLRRMDAWVVGSSRFVAKAWASYVPPDRLRVVYNGVGGGMAAPPARNGCRVGCIGRIAPEKGQFEFIAAARAIYRARPDCRFFIYGEPLFAGNHYAARVRSAASGLPIEFPGWTPNVYAALAKLDLLLVPSAAHEATPRVILEAFSAGVPIIAFRSGGIPELIEHGRTGYLAQDATEMARTAIELLNDEARRAAIAAVAHESWKRRFTIERYREQILHAIEAATETAQRRAAPTR